VTNATKTNLIWLQYLLRGLLGRRAYLGLTPPFVREQRLQNRASGKWLKLAIRDADDWIQIEHIFLNNEFDLSGTARAEPIKQHYERLLCSGSTPLIVDLGANIGLVSRYFNEKFPQADIISVEPDAGNCAIARRNLPTCATLIQAAVASHNGRASLVDTGRNCGFRVNDDCEGDVKLVTVPDLLERAGEREPFIIKIDIEGFEEDLFSGDVGWIDRFPVLLIELHDWMLPGRCVTHNFLSAIASRRREFMHFGGFVVSLSTDL
jgi:FkbM family methyltransferase